MSSPAPSDGGGSFQPRAQPAAPSPIRQWLAEKLPPPPPPADAASAGRTAPDMSPRMIGQWFREKWGDARPPKLWSPVWTQPPNSLGSSIGYSALYGGAGGLAFGTAICVYRERQHTTPAPTATASASANASTATASTAAAKTRTSELFDELAGRVWRARNPTKLAHATTPAPLRELFQAIAQTRITPEMWRRWRYHTVSTYTRRYALLTASLAGSVYGVESLRRDSNLLTGAIGGALTGLFIAGRHIVQPPVVHPTLRVTRRSDAFRYSAGPETYITSIDQNIRTETRRAVARTAIGAAVGVALQAVCVYGLRTPHAAQTPLEWIDRRLHTSRAVAAIRNFVFPAARPTPPTAATGSTI